MIDKITELNIRGISNSDRSNFYVENRAKRKFSAFTSIFETAIKNILKDGKNGFFKMELVIVRKQS